MVKCKDCIHNEVCLYIWEFTFEGTDSRKQYRELPDSDLDVNRHCGHWMKANLIPDYKITNRSGREL